MVIRKLLLIALVVLSGTQSIVHASDAPRAKAEKTESWGTWYKRNQVLFGAAVGAMVSFANRSHSADARDVLAAAYLTLAGSVAGKMNVLPGYVLGICSGLMFGGPSNRDPILTTLIGGVAGAIIHGLYSSQQPKEKANKK